MKMKMLMILAVLALVLVTSTAAVPFTTFVAWGPGAGSHSPATSANALVPEPTGLLVLGFGLVGLSRCMMRKGRI